MTAQHDRDLHAAEDELASYRHLKATLAAFIHNPAWDRDARIALAAAAGLPGPAKEQPCTSPTTPQPISAPPPTRPAQLASST